MTTVHDLLAHPELGLRELHRTPASGRDISWVSASDLPDPARFLVSDQLLLTTGLQFPEGTRATEYRAYVDRLVARDVLGVGFGTEVLRSGTPGELVDACREAGLALVEVPFRTPFLAIIRHVAREQERAARRRDDWAASTSRAISGAASADGDLSAVLRELASRLTSRVVLFDADGEVESSFPRGGPVSADVAARVRGLLAAGARAADEFREGDTTTTLHTVGPGGALAGVLSVAGARPDRAARAVLATALALVEVGGAEQRRAARGSLARNAVVLRLLREGRRDLAADVAVPAGLTLPGGAATVVATVADAALAEREVRGAGRLVALDGDALVALVPERSGSATAQRWAAWGHPVGTARLDDLASSAGAVTRALAARGRALAGTVVDWAELPAPGDLSAAAETAAARLAPLRATRDGAQQIEAATAWFAATCAWGPAGRALGIHPHTVRDRVDALGRALGFDLDGFEGRALLWATLTASS